MKPNKHKEALLSIDRLDELLSYDEYTGIITSLAQRGPIRIGQRLGCLDKVSGYRYIMIDGSRYLEHRLIWFIMNLSWPNNIIDHIDNNRSNNTYSNLRNASYKLNSANKINNSTIGCNITKQNNNFMVTILTKGIRKSFGTCNTLEKAVYIRDTVTNYMDTDIEVPSKGILKEVAKNANLCN